MYSHKFACMPHLRLYILYMPPRGKAEVQAAYLRIRPHERNYYHMDKIIINWHEKGRHTPEEIEEGDTGRASRTRRVKKTEAENKAKAPSAEETNRLLKLIERMGE